MYNLPPKLNIDLFDGYDGECEYNKSLAEHFKSCAKRGISEAEARADWIKNNAKGKDNWIINHAPTLNARGQQILINTINNLIEYLQNSK